MTSTSPKLPTMTLAGFRSRVTAYPGTSGNPGAAGDRRDGAALPTRVTSVAPLAPLPDAGSRVCSVWFVGELSASPAADGVVRTVTFAPLAGAGTWVGSVGG